MTRQRTISFSDSQYEILEKEWKQYNANNTPELHFSQYIGLRLQNEEDKLKE